MSPHSHDTNPDRDVRLLSAAGGLLILFMAAEVAVAISAHSLALLADAGHMLTDVLALVMAIAAARLALRPAGGAWTYGFARLEILSAAVNGVTLLVVAAVVAVEAIRRLVDPANVSGGPMAATAAAGLVVNVIATLLLSRADRRSLNIAGAFAHVMTDAAAFAATGIAGLVILGTGWRRVDPVASLVVVVLMLVASTKLLRKSGVVLLEAAPEHVDLLVLREHLLESGDGEVLDVHDLHAWTVGSGLPAVSAHVVVSDRCFEDGLAAQLLDELQHCLAGHFDVEHSTFQFELAGHTEHEPGTH